MTGGLTARQRATVGLAGVARAASGGMLATALVVYVGRLGSPIAVGMLATTFFLSMIVFPPLWGALGDLVGRRRTLLYVSGLLTLAMLPFVLARSVWEFVGLRGVYAAFAVGFAPLMLAVVNEMGGRAHRGRSSGFFSSSLAGGDVGGQVLVGFLLGAVAPSELYLIVAAISFAGTVVLVAVEEPNATAGDAPALEELPAAIRARLPFDAAQRRALRETGLTGLYVGVALRHFTVKGVASFVPIYLLVRIGLSAVTMGLLLALTSAVQVGFMALSGRLADAGSRKRLVALGAVSSGAYALLLAAATVPNAGAVRVGVIGAGLVLMAAGFAAIEIGTISLIGDAVPASRESAFLGLQSTMAGIGGVAGPAVVGVAAALVGYELAFALVSGSAFCAAALVQRTVAEPERTGPRAAELGVVETASGIPRPITADHDPGTGRGDEG